MKLMLTDELVKKAVAGFMKWGWTLPTGAEGLSRGELRLLWRKGLVERVQKMLPSGTVVNVWTWKGPKK